PEVLNGVKERHDYYKKALNQLNEKYEVFKAIRGSGLLLGCVLKDEFAGKAKDINNLAGEEGLLSLIAGPNVVRFTPSLIVPFADIDEGLKRFERALARFVEIQKDEQAA
ncbi:aminotransferase class III-fold pyridoxal phosphate-dependent enzyme, partial [Acinetobacter baumannii]|nr:aminotransferase class III-fold pyridoxal phosphate-dependent enzyme [Acinetobacter baumannii]EKU9667954.1 aminotransferase class III-fold pyridoxal phosphate-dependent enzyme [Acinetobacter baumannii]EKV1229011.1 aminotransferase class III-fold pyridoxal phosphate-dependent enzyme [Acinetobacter baumannii]EKV1520375.1 aminotransferase class III-fold pyridoxal phosphate-dependent enzyme [Acinetobacter baumannii]MBE2570057.1 aminotransferase class III-fold pyridoxal phosphate-dependent enzyme